jgi:outer membrane immunogenic protein
MKSKLEWAIASALLAGSMSTAFAADLPVKAPPPPPPAPVLSWTGFYIGINGGYGWNQNQDVDISGSPLVTGAQQPGVGTVPFFVGLKPEGWLAGGTIGWNYQFGRGVVGVEADFDWAGIKDSRFIDLPAAAPTVRTSASQKIDYFGTVRGRLGFLAADPLVLYATGGMAYANVKNDANIDEFFNLPMRGSQFIASSSGVRYGWTTGAGAEWKFTRNWRLTGEYLYYDLGSQTIRGNESNRFIAINFATYTFATRGNIVRAGINYQFGGAP